MTHTHPCLLHLFKEFVIISVQFLIILKPQLMVSLREEDRTDLRQPVHQRQAPSHPFGSRITVILSAFERLFVMLADLPVHDQISADDHRIRSKLFDLLYQLFIVVSVGIFVKIGYKYQFYLLFYPG